MKLSRSFIGILILITIMFAISNNKPPVSKKVITHATSKMEKNKYETAGIDNSLEFNKTFITLKKLVTSNDKEKVANYIIYPLKVNTPTQKFTIKTKEEFIAQYNTIFTTKIKTALTNQKIEDLFVNYQGVMVKDGEIWLGKSNSKYGIIVINQ